MANAVRLFCYIRTLGTCRIISIEFGNVAGQLPSLMSLGTVVHQIKVGYLYGMQLHELALLLWRE